MSRTDAHRPFWVWFQDEPGLVRDEHHHRDGACDIAEFSAKDRRPRTACQRTLEPWPRLCNCELCAAHTQRRAGRRSIRNAERMLARAAETGVDEDALDRYADGISEHTTW